MKDIKVSELKAHLSKYLRMASRGMEIVVNDRDQPIARIGPPGEALEFWTHDARQATAALSRGLAVCGV